VGLGFELRASHMLGRYSIRPPVLFALVILETTSCFLAQAGLFSGSLRLLAALDSVIRRLQNSLSLVQESRQDA
jgi:hypothetical protein